MNLISSEQTTRQNILLLLDELPPDSLSMVETFVRFVHAQQPAAKTAAGTEQPPWRYPTVPVAASSLDNWLALLSEGYEGDALADTEALYDEV